jgi:hypothetical protein
MEMVAIASSIDSGLVVHVYTVGMTAEAALAEHARALHSAAEHERAVQRAAALLEQAHAAVSAEGIVTIAKYGRTNPHRRS